MAPNPAVALLLRQGLEELGSSVADRELVATRLAELCELVHAWGQRLNLTAHRSPEAIARELALDAVALESVIGPTASLADIGSGAGFPGLPIAILRPDSVLTLIEARERRHHFLRHAIRTLGLSNVQALHGRAEALEPAPHACVVAQGAGPFSEVIGWMLRWAMPGGRLVIPLSDRQRVDVAPKGVAEARLVEYSVPLSGRARRAWIGVRQAT